MIILDHFLMSLFSLRSIVIIALFSIECIILHCVAIIYYDIEIQFGEKYLSNNRFLIWLVLIVLLIHSVSD